MVVGIKKERLLLARFRYKVLVHDIRATRTVVTDSQSRLIKKTANDSTLTSTSRTNKCDGLGWVE